MTPTATRQAASALAGAPAALADRTAFPQDLPFDTVISKIETDFKAAYYSGTSLGQMAFPYSSVDSKGVVTLDPLHVRQYFLNYTTPQEADCIWRIVLLLGCFPAIALFYKVLRMPETTRYTALVKGDAEQAARDLEAQTRGKAPSDPVEAKNNSKPPKYLPAREFFRKYGVWLLGTSSSWFLLDVAFYSQSLYGPIIYGVVGFVPAATTMSAIHETFM